MYYAVGDKVVFA